MIMELLIAWWLKKKHAEKNEQQDGKTTKDAKSDQKNMKED